MKYNDIDILVAFFGAIKDEDEECTETKLNVKKMVAIYLKTKQKQSFMIISMY